MIERVAAAMDPHLWSTETRERAILAGLQLEHTRMCLDSVIRARLAITAMREPTEAMITAGHESGQWGPGVALADDALDDATSDTCWRAMIDEALK